MVLPYALFNIDKVTLNIILPLSSQLCLYICYYVYVRVEDAVNTGHKLMSSVKINKLAEIHLANTVKLISLHKPARNIKPFWFTYENNKMWADMH